MPVDCAKIRFLRLQRGLTQEEAARLAQLSERYGRQRWNAIESGRQASITVETLERIARALGVKAKDLLK